MLIAELRKTWSRPLVAAAFVLVCLAQVFYGLANFDADDRTVGDAWNRFGRAMDETWRASIYEQYDRLWPTPPNTQEEVFNASAQQRAVLAALDYTAFTQRVDAVVEGLQAHYGADPNFDPALAERPYAGLRAASENGELVFGMSLFGSSMSSQYMVTWGFLIFMILLCADQFSGERAVGMTSMQAVAKGGRRKLYWTKFQVCQISALAVWIAANFCCALTLLGCYGPGNLESVVQDFTYNACPYNWNTGEFMAVVLTVSLTVSQLVAVVIFLLARMSSRIQKSFAMMGCILLLPYLIASQTGLLGIALWLPCLMHGSWLWQGLIFWKLFGIYVQPWMLAAVEVLVIAVICVLALLHFARRADEC